MKTDTTNQIKAEVMVNCFATHEFLEFSSTCSKQFVHGAASARPGFESFPCLIVDSDRFSPSQAQFVITPICLSGPLEFNERTIPTLLESLSEYNIAGGFVQTRDPSGCARGMQQFGESLAFSDVRTNYRLELGQNEDDFLTAMKRDSRGRSRKWLRQRETLSLELPDKRDAASIKVFADLYQENAARLGFAAAYRFSEEDFKILLSSDLWNLYLLKSAGRVVAGSIVGTLESGFDYTFMAYTGDIPDVGRANIIYLYQYLSRHYSGYLDLGGGIKENDSLARFKVGLGAIETGFTRVKFANLNHPALSHSNDKLAEMLHGHWP